MSNERDSQQSIGTLVFDIEQLFKNLASDKSLLDENELHAFGPVNLDKSRLEFRQYIASIRELCSQFETEVFKDVSKMGTGADPAFRKQFTKLKEQASIESTVAQLKESLQRTRTFIEASISNHNTPSSNGLLIQRLERFAQSIGLFTFVDLSQKQMQGDTAVSVTRITLGGTVIVVDIDVSDESEVLKTKVTYVTSALQDDPDTRIDQLLADNLRSKDFGLFQRNLSTLALLDRFNVKHAPVDFFIIIRRLLDDLRSICRNELKLVSDDIQSVLMSGHGIPSFHLGFPGISIAYWIDKELTRRDEWENVKEYTYRRDNHPLMLDAWRLLISFEESNHPHQFMPPSKPHYMIDTDPEDEDVLMEVADNPIDQFKVVEEPSAPSFSQPISFHKPLPTLVESPAIPVRFVALLDPPLPACDGVAQSLMVAAGLSEKTTPGRLRDDQNTGQSLEDMLCTFKDNEVKEEDDYVCLPLHHTLTCTMTHDDTSDQTYSWTKNKHLSGRRLNRIPMSHPVQLFSILQCLRQQLMFNTLFSSMFRHCQSIAPTTTPTLDAILQGDAAETAWRVQASTTDAPHALHLTLSPPPQPDQPLVLMALTIDISPDTPSQPTVRLQPPFSSPMDPSQETMWDTQVFDEHQMTHVIQGSHAVPPLVRWISKRAEQPLGHYIRTLKRAKRMRID